MSGDLAARWRNNAIFECVLLREFALHLPRVFRLRRRHRDGEHCVALGIVHN